MQNLQKKHALLEADVAAHQVREIIMNCVQGTLLGIILFLGGGIHRTEKFGKDSCYINDKNLKIYIVNKFIFMTL